MGSGKGKIMKRLQFFDTKKLRYGYFYSKEDLDDMVFEAQPTMTLKIADINESIFTDTQILEHIDQAW